MKIRTETLLYHYLQKELYETDVWLFQMLTARLIAGLGIWFSPEIYTEIPILLPFAIRDPSCRKSNNKLKEEWGEPNQFGLFRDDNSLVKNIPQTLIVNSKLKDIYDGKQIGTGFVASHIWRITNTEEFDNSKKLTTRNPYLNSFIPNLVWLPKEVSRLSDREGSFVQLYLQALSIKIYKNVTLNKELSGFISDIWNLLEIPTGIPESGLPAVDELNYFSYEKGFSIKRIQSLHKLHRSIKDLIKNEKITKKIISSRYTVGLNNMKIERLNTLDKILSVYTDKLHLNGD